MKEREKRKIEGIGKTKLMKEKESIGGIERERTEDTERNERGKETIK